MELLQRTFDKICHCVVTPDALTSRDIVAQAHRFVQLRWLTLACSTAL